MAGRIKPISAPTLDKKLPRNKRPIIEGKDAQYLAWLHTLPCCVSLRWDHIHAHHPTVGRGRMGRKEDDATAIPLNEEYHLDQFEEGVHNGEVAFWNRHGIDPTALADDLYACFKAGLGRREAVDIIDAHRALAHVRSRLQIKVFVDKNRRIK